MTWVSGQELVQYNLSVRVVIRLTGKRSDEDFSLQAFFVLQECCDYAGERVRIRRKHLLINITERRTIYLLRTYGYATIVSCVHVLMFRLVPVRRVFVASSSVST